MNDGISDLWFNHDKSAAENPKGPKGEFAGYDESRLNECAETFRNMLRMAGIAPPSVEDLIADFEARI